MSAEQVIQLPDGQRLTADAALQPWKTRAKLGQEARGPFEAQWKLNEAFAAGNQWFRIQDGGGRRTLRDVRASLRADGRSVQEADVLTQFLWTAIGKLATDDFRPELITQHEDEEGDQNASLLNKTYGFGWDEEWKGDQRCLDILHGIAVYGTVPVRCRYDRGRGPFLGDVPHAPAGGYTYSPPDAEPQTFDAGRPILDPAAARAHVADARQYGEPVDLRPLREGAVVWEVGDARNMLPPPGVKNAEDFPYDLLVRAVHIETLKSAYPAKRALIHEEPVELDGVLGTGSQTNPMDGQSSNSRLSEHCLVYTGYLRPTINHPRGQTIVWTGDTVLELSERLSYNAAPWGPRPGVTYFKYWPVKGRFWGRALIEPMIGIQRIRNKRLSQMDEIVDRGLPFGIVNEGDIPDKSGTPLEWVELKAGSSSPVINPGIGPGRHMEDSIERCDTDMQKAAGLNDISLGANAPAGTPYASLAQQNENDQTKIGPIVQAFKLGVAELTRDSLEAMRQWPEGKTLMIVGDEDRLEVIVHKRQNLPDGYMVRPAKGGGLPRSQGAELQKINDLWTAAETSGVVAQDPVAWLEWYKASLDAGQAQDFPAMSARAQQQHKAALENVIMLRGELVPVAPFDDPQVHIAEHDREQAQLAQAAAEGDERAALLSEVIERHKQLHLQMAAQNASKMAPASPGIMAGGMPPPALGAGPAAGPPAPPSSQGAPL